MYLWRRRRRRHLEPSCMALIRENCANRSRRWRRGGGVEAWRLGLLLTMNQQHQVLQLWYFYFWIFQADVKKNLEIKMPRIYVVHLGNSRELMDTNFHPPETIQCLIDLLNKVVAHPELPFDIYTTPKKQTKDMLQDFFAAGFVPGAIVVDPTPSPPIGGVGYFVGKSPPPTPHLSELNECHQRRYAWTSWISTSPPLLHRPPLSPEFLRMQDEVDDPYISKKDKHDVSSAAAAASISTSVSFPSFEYTIDELKKQQSVGSISKIYLPVLQATDFGL